MSFLTASMQTAELTSKLADLKAELFNLRFQHAINQLANPGDVYKRQLWESCHEVTERVRPLPLV